MNVSEITPRHARRYRDEHPKLVTAQRELTLLKTALGEATEWGWLDQNPLIGFKLLTEKRKKRYISDTEWDSILNAADADMAALLKIALYTALRKSDLCGLTWSNVRGNTMHVQTQKTKAPLEFQLDESTAAAFAHLRGPATPFPRMPVFRSKTGRRLTDRNADNYWWAICEKAGITDVTFHDIRRKRITDLATSYGRDFAQTWASHSDAKSTQSYLAAPVTKLAIPKEAPLISTRISGQKTEP